MKTFTINEEMERLIKILKKTGLFEFSECIYYGDIIKAKIISSEKNIYCSRGTGYFGFIFRSASHPFSYKYNGEKFGELLNYITNKQQYELSEIMKKEDVNNSVKKKRL